jgi:hypothetical protein
VRDDDDDDDEGVIEMRPLRRQLPLLNEMK